ncbi:MAG: mechanosensitive ion channel family protein [Chromatiales bacterium]|nr:mechanosensitive ion channel family protein [Chromatiales bacterium]
MQETLGNILGGIALQMDSSIDKDDWIAINGITGRVECYRLDKSAIEDLMQARPAMAEAISRIMVERQIALEHARQDLDTISRQRMLDKHSDELLDKIKRNDSPHASS